MSDSIARNVYLTLVKDFRLFEGPDFASSALHAFNRGIKSYREYQFPEIGEISAQRYKAYWQLQNLFKRYRFDVDRFTDDELEANTLEKFKAFQVTRSVYKPFKASTFMVLREARRICKSILCEPYDPAKFRRNGNRATLDVKLRDAYFDNKWGAIESFTCPSALRGDFFQEIKNDQLLKRVAQRMLRLSKKAGMPLKLSADTLDLTLVPKSWKTLRCITPLSVFGLYWSFGIGGYVEDCLKMSGLDISRLQKIHQGLARRYSKTRTHVTADLSSASDSLRSDILNFVLPRKIYTDLRKTFVKTVRIGGSDHHTVSSLPMGNGATFPIETLVFYCLIKAIGNLLKVKGVFSVYGDDLIYPRRIHHHVRVIFADLGIAINADKTFAQSHFRESCGGDYYHGIDVRPALFPADKMSSGSRLKQLQYLYKVLNSLLLRWNKYEIPHTYRYLLSEIMFRAKEIYQVPMSYPATSGLQVEQPLKEDWPFTFKTPKRFLKDGSCFVSFKFIGSDRPNSRVIIHQDIYYWDAMRLKLRTCVDPPVSRETWGRYSCPGMTRELARWFLKASSISDGIVSGGYSEMEEALHESGSTKVCMSVQSSWT